MGTCTLYMNGRGGKRFNPYRTQYYSYDDGTSWTAGEKSVLEEDAGGCEGSVINYDNTLFFLEPAGKKRTKMVMHCSRDQGKSWSYSTVINGDYRGGYSDMVGLDTGNILAVWEDGSHPLSHASHTDKSSF